MPARIGVKLRKEADDFIMENYGKKPVFASFLPGISGIRGIPVWCYYVNRGQCVASFGVQDKDHAVMEFYPAHQAYQNVKTTGFRTFIRKDGSVTEAFAREEIPHSMRISMNGLAIEERNEEAGLLTEVSYFTLPGERVGALARRVTVTNIGDKAADVEMLDGMPAVIPYGVNMDSMKNMGQTAKAWMQAEDVEERTPYFRVRVSMDDTAAVKKIEGGNFSAGFRPDGGLLPCVVDASLIFSYDVSLRRAVGFEEGGLKGLLEKRQNTQNLLPCSFFGAAETLAPGQSVAIHELIGQVEKKELLREFLEGKRGAEYFAAKEAEAAELTRSLTEVIRTRTASEAFDAYCRYTYMDNVLRGGSPIRLGHNKVFYVYSRKHGDLERDYNYFSMLPEFYSQGNGNFRDVNQNRRSDTFFSPFVGRENIHTFYSLIQLDGYNPLGVEKLTYTLGEQEAEVLFGPLGAQAHEQLAEFTARPFTPGSLCRKLEETLGEGWNETLFIQIMDFARQTVNGSFGEGYWSDHWTYNLDLIMDYLEIFPDQERELLYEEAYTSFLSQAEVNPRFARYEETEAGLRQYHALKKPSPGRAAADGAQKSGAAGRACAEADQKSGAAGRDCAEADQKSGVAGRACAEADQRSGAAGRACAEADQESGAHGKQQKKETTEFCADGDKLVRTDFGRGEPLTMTLLEKLTLLCAVKFATLDAYGMGIEMEGGKPGWYDALNGMPGMFGSSMAETYELSRMLEYTIGAMEKYPGELPVLEELAVLLEEADRINREERESLMRGGEALSFWNRINDAKEAYREKIYRGVSGKKRRCSTEGLTGILKGFAETVSRGIEKACGLAGDVCPAYFTYEAPEYEALAEGGCRPLAFRVRPVPCFLEGPVRYLKLKCGVERKRKLYESVKNSGLYDTALSMYKVNAPLREASFELGRARAFTPGWLENESVWLHMEYKYLLELLRSGMYEEFFEDFHRAGVPFLDPEVYGRSIYENSSFIASSANPDEGIRGRGFVARLSGSTAEFLSMWKLMLFGPGVFSLKDEELAFCPRPALPAWLIPGDGRVEAMLLGTVQVVYRFREARDYIPGGYEIRCMSFIGINGSEASTELPSVTGRLAEAVRAGQIRQITIDIV